VAGRGVGGRAASFGLADSMAVMTARMSSRPGAGPGCLGAEGLQVNGCFDGQPSGRPDGGRVGVLPSIGPGASACRTRTTDRAASTDQEGFVVCRHNKSFLATLLFD
jgi:hypothetical protein